MFSFSVDRQLWRPRSKNRYVRDETNRKQTNNFCISGLGEGSEKMPIDYDSLFHVVMFASALSRTNHHPNTLNKL